MNDSELTQGDADLQRLQKTRHEQLSCLFDVDSNLEALPPPQAKPRVRQAPQKPLEFPNHNPIAFNATAAALEALSKPRRKKPGGSKQPPAPRQPPLTQPPTQLLTEAELAALYGSKAPTSQSFQVEQPSRYSSTRPVPRRFTLVSLWCRGRHFAGTQPQEAAKVLAQHVAFVALGGSIRLFAPNPTVVPLLVGLGFITVFLLLLLRPGWREQALLTCLLLGLCLSGFF